VEGSKITRLGGTVPVNAITYDLATLTVTPGWIDTHAHIVNHFDNGNRLSGSDEPGSQASWHIAETQLLRLMPDSPPFRVQAQSRTRICATP